MLRESPKEIWSMSVSDWTAIFAALDWDICIFAKGVIDEGTWKLDLAARLAFGTYVTIEHSTAQRVHKTGRHRRHFGFFPGVGLWRYRQHLRRSARSLSPSRVICVSDEGRRRLIGEYGFRRSSVVTIRNGIDPDRFRRDETAGIKWRERNAIPPKALLFGSLGRIDQGKQLDIVVRELLRVIEAAPDSDPYLAIIGEGPEQESIRELAKHAPHGERIIVLPFSDRPWDALSAIDVFVMPSVMEGLPLALLEAMGCGCPAIASAVGGIPEVITGPEYGWLVPPTTPGAFGEAMIEAALFPPDARREMAARVRDRVRTAFDSTIQLNRLVDELEACKTGIGTQPAPAPTSAAIS
jgi:glycosyltransferase involved in cell wall biosynthesis